MSMLVRKLLRDLHRSRGLLLAITSIIAVGIMCFVSLFSAYNNLQGAKEAYYRQCRMADFWITLKKAPRADLSKLLDIPGVTEIHPRIQFYATVDIEGNAEAVNGLVLSLPDRPEKVINDIVLKQAGYFTNRRDNEVIVNDAFARAHRLAPGQTIHLLLNNRRQELLIVGTAISSEFTYLLGPGAIMPDPDHFGVFYVKQSFAEDVFDFEGAANQVVGRIDPRFQLMIDPILEQAEVILEPYGVFSTTPLEKQASNQFLTNEIDGLGAIATVVPTIFLAVAALVLNVLITRLARQQRVVIGTLKALGYTNWQVFLHFSQLGLVVGGVGSVIGSVLGYSYSAYMTSIYRRFFEFPQLESGFYWYTHGIGLLVSLGCATAGTLYGARAMLRLQPAEAMRPEPPSHGGPVWLERFRDFWQSLSTGWRVALRTIIRHRFRTAVAIFATAMGCGLLVTGFMMVEAQDHLLDFEFYRVMRSDLDVVFRDTQGWDALQEVRGLPSVDQAEPRYELACTMEHLSYRHKGAVTGLLRDARLTVPRNERGEPVHVPPTGLLLNRRLAETLRAEPGDYITITPVKGTQRPVEAPVAGITDGYVGMTAYADIFYLSNLTHGGFAMSGAQVTAPVERAALERLYQELKQLSSVQSVSSRRDIVHIVRQTLLENQYIIISVLIIFSGVILFSSTLNASMVNLAERQLEVGTLQALGYSPWQVGNMFLRESLISSSIGAVLGLPSGYLLTVLTAWSYENDLLRLPVVWAPWIAIAAIALSLIFALLAHAVIQWQILKMDLLEALKVRE